MKLAQFVGLAQFVELAQFAGLVQFVSATYMHMFIIKKIFLCIYKLIGKHINVY